MRNLSIKQKNMLKKLVDTKDVSSTSDLTLEEMNALESINDHETLWQNSDRFIHDYRWSKIK